MIEFRRAGCEDALTIVRLRQKCWDCTYRGIYPDDAIDGFDYEWHLRMEHSRLMKEAYQCYLVLDGEKPAGYFAYGVVHPDVLKGFFFRLHSLYLLPAYQGRGLGRKIFSNTIQRCRDMGYDRLFLNCHPQNNNALAFYRHMGGVISHVDDGHENPQEDGCTVEFYFTEGE